MHFIHWGIRPTVSMRSGTAAGSVGLSILFVFLFAVCFSANRQYAGFVVNNVNPMEINSLAEICAVFLLFFLFCVGNWSITCLMDGEEDLRISLRCAVTQCFQ